MDPICGKCKYDLTGLPEEGSCPECGQKFNLRTGYGLRTEITAEERGQRLFKRIRTISIGCFGFIILGCSGLLSTVAASPERPLIVGSILTVICIAGAVTSYMYEKD